MKEVIKMEKFKAFVMSTEFVSGLVDGFTLGALHHYLGSVSYTHLTLPTIA